MSVLIKNMAIPEKCDDCRFCSRRWYDTIFDGFCEVSHVWIDNTLERYKKCPLIQVEEGR